jgi:hypothetical protein
MDRVASPVSEAEDTDQLVFGARLLRPWLVANFLAFTIGFAVSGGVLRAMTEPYYGSDMSAIEAARIQAVASGTAGLIIGAVLGFGQWLVLRRSIRAAFWMPATCLGWVLAGALAAFNAGGRTSTIGPDAGPVPALLAIIVIPPLAVLLLSAGQWLVLRRDCANVGWWPIVNVGAFLVASVTGVTIAKLDPWLAGTHYPSAQALAVVGAVAGPIYGYLTWLFLAQLRRRAASAPS